MSEENNTGRSYVLVADDDEAIVRFVADVVESEGLETVSASNGKAAYKVLKSGKDIACAVIDMRMPYIEGTELVRFMHSDDKYSTIPVIMMTEDADLRTTSKTYGSGAVAYLPKPFTKYQLRLMLRTFINREHNANS